MMPISKGLSPAAKAEMVVNEKVRWVLDYYVQTYQSSNGSELYGIKVDKLDDEGVIAESSETFAITDDRNKAMSMLSFLAKGSVPPCVLLEMVDEWFAAFELNAEDYADCRPLPV